MTMISINVGNEPNDNTGDELRTCFIKINANFDQLFASGPVRHRQAVLEYRENNGVPQFLIPNGSNVNLVSPLVGSVMAGVDSRAELNAMILVNNNVDNAWSFTGDGTYKLYIGLDFVTRELYYGSTSNVVWETQDEPSTAVVGDHWVDRLHYNVWHRVDGYWEQVLRLFVGEVTVSSGVITSVTHSVDNEELSLARKEAQKASLIFG